MTKAILRKKIISKRSLLSLKEIDSKSSEIYKKIILLPEFKKAKVVSIYISTKNEVQTKKIIQYSLKNNKRVVVPYMKNQKMLMKEITTTNFDCEIVQSIKQPKSIAKTIDNNLIDFIFLPCVAFDQELNRLGYGFGCYDKLIKNTDAYKCLLAFKLQEYNKIPIESHDVEVDRVITE